jgi:hypothetical protein
VLGAALIIGAGCATPTGGCGRVLGLSPMRAIGRVSYSWYLWHWPVLLLAPPLLGHPLGLTERLAAAAVSGVLAVLTLRLLENPIRFAAPLRQSAAASLAVGGVATAAAVCVGIALLVFLPTPVGRSLATQTLTGTLGPPPVGGNVDQYNAAIRRAYAQVQTATMSPRTSTRRSSRKPETSASFSTDACAITSRSDNPNARWATLPRRPRWP